MSRRGLEAEGPARRDWSRRGPLKGQGKGVDTRHCHLNKGRSVYVVEWRAIDNDLENWRRSMMADLITRTIGETVEINLSVTVPVAKSELMVDNLKLVLRVAGHGIWHVNDGVDASVTVVEEFSDKKPKNLIQELLHRYWWGINQKDIADKLEIPLRHVFEMQMGYRPIDLEMAKLIEKNFNVSRKALP
ncbi:MAG: helix-turn-helix domain-containing protein [Deltaproteobacteria bacterium]|nr:helix-turn-helix domain-containing protein [Deltaproteobacteria bacterium]